MRMLPGTLLAAAAVASTGASLSAQAAVPTIVLVHGAFAESLSWETVLSRLTEKGYRVVALPNPLRGPKSDAAYIKAHLANIAGPIVLVGHSYGGTVISNAATDQTKVKALVFVSAFAPEMGETAGQVGDRFPGGTLNAALAPAVTLPDGNKDVLIDVAKYPAQFAADVPLPIAKLLAETQRPIAQAAFTEPSGAPAWKKIPSWFIYGTADRNIPPAALEFMAKRAGSKETIVVKGASHVVMVSHPDDVAALIDRAARTVRQVAERQ